MRLIKFTFLVFFFISLKSCLVPLSPHHHYFIANESGFHKNPKLLIFSTPKYKNYIVTNVDIQAKIFIQSPIFENPESYYLMDDGKYYDNDAKQFKFTIGDKQFYSSNKYNSITLKIIKDGIEEIIVYKLDHK